MEFFTLSLNVTYKRVGERFVGGWMRLLFSCAGWRVSPHSSKVVRVIESFCKPLDTPVLVMALTLLWLFEISVNN